MPSPWIATVDSSDEILCDSLGELSIGVDSSSASLTHLEKCADNQVLTECPTYLSSEDRVEFNIKQTSPDRFKGGCVVLGIYSDKKLTSAAIMLDRVSGGEIARLLALGDFDGKVGSTRILYGVSNTSAERILLVGLGESKTIAPSNWLSAVRASAIALVDTGAQDAAFFLAEIPVERRDMNWKGRQLAVTISDAVYRFSQLKSVQPAKRPFGKISFCVANQRDLRAAQRGLKEGIAIAAGMSLTKDLGNLPGNICTPTYLAEQSVRVAREWKIQSEVLEQADMERLGMGALLSVTKGSRQPPKFIVLRYFGAARKERPIVLVGKGITFDTGGISLKPGAEMDEMKFDMCGAASVIGTLRAVAEIRLPVNVIGLIPTCENMPDGAATRPGDVVTSMSGQTIEILNTDAEGRLILCDALTYAERFEPKCVIDIATLTGACIIALGNVCSGLFTGKDLLARDLLAAGDTSGDRAWRLPLWDDYQDQLKSNFADFANVGSRAAGRITAACFLSRFTKKYDWAHLDIAGTAWRSGKDKGASGRPVPLLVQFLSSQTKRR